MITKRIPNTSLSWVCQPVSHLIQFPKHFGVSKLIPKEKKKIVIKSIMIVEGGIFIF